MKLFLCPLIVFGFEKRQIHQHFVSMGPTKVLFSWSVFRCFLFEVRIISLRGTKENRYCFSVCGCGSNVPEKCLQMLEHQRRRVDGRRLQYISNGLCMQHGNGEASRIPDGNNSPTADMEPRNYSDNGDTVYECHKGYLYPFLQPPSTVHHYQGPIKPYGGPSAM
ncbi:hypothetical protein AVEN_225853-1 [Araneus ventricosus]|uniref:Uncharacterized protein n=1 Tax=Araneus ventricosus TaxID=182803 RepID=A0A4Y2BDX1_ARAVE|nr:hypothetical protein AVEN_225853-1 [Araneus ventricosus]